MFNVCEQLVAVLCCSNSQHCWMLYVASVCTPCCMLSCKVWNQSNFTFILYWILFGVGMKIYLLYAPKSDCLIKKYTGLLLRFSQTRNSKVQKPPLQLRFSLPSIIITITSNKPWNTETHKTDWNPPITRPFEPVKVKLFPKRSVKMIDGSETCNHQLAFEIQNSHVCEMRSNFFLLFSGVLNWEWCLCSGAAVTLIFLLVNDTVLYVFQISRQPALSVATSLVQHLFTIDLTNLFLQTWAKWKPGSVWWDSYTLISFLSCFSLIPA